jgi:hypothetical protein
LQNKYKNLDDKLKKLSKKQITTHASNEIIKYFPRVINKTDIVFSNEEYTVLRKGLKYNLYLKKKDWIKNIPLEAEKALNFVHVKDQDFLRSLMAKNIETSYKTKIVEIQCLILM